VGEASMGEEEQEEQRSGWIHSLPNTGAGSRLRDEQVKDGQHWESLAITPQGLDTRNALSPTASLGTRSGG
jgi:hypothetical protein